MKGLPEAQKKHEERVESQTARRNGLMRRGSDLLRLMLLSDYEISPGKENLIKQYGDYPLPSPERFQFSDGCKSWVNTLAKGM